MIAGGLLAFSFAMLEVSDSLIPASERTGCPITKVIYAPSRNVGIGVPLASNLDVGGMLRLTAKLVILPSAQLVVDPAFNPD